MLKIEYTNVDKLKLHDHNPRTISESDFKKLVKSIKDNPDYFEVRPILARLDGVIFAGNQRYRAALEAGLKEVPAVFMDITPEKEKELMIRDNVSNGEWDFDQLANDWDPGQLEDWGLPMQKLFDDFDQDPKEKKKVACPECGAQF